MLKTHDNKGRGIFGTDSGIGRSIKVVKHISLAGTLASDWGQHCEFHESKVKTVKPYWSNIIYLNHFQKFLTCFFKYIQSYPILCDPMDCSLPGSSVHVILQAGILEWVATFFSRGSSWSRDQTWVSCLAGRFFTIWTTREASDFIYWFCFYNKLHTKFYYFHNGRFWTKWRQWK